MRKGLQREKTARTRFSTSLLPEDKLNRPSACSPITWHRFRWHRLFLLLTISPDTPCRGSFSSCCRNLEKATVHSEKRKTKEKQILTRVCGERKNKTLFTRFTQNLINLLVNSQVMLINTHNENTHRTVKGLAFLKETVMTEFRTKIISYFYYLFVAVAEILNGINSKNCWNKNIFIYLSAFVQMVWKYANVFLNKCYFKSENIEFIFFRVFKLFQQAK